jgi:Domain of unknown function (DUF4276)
LKELYVLCEGPTERGFCDQVLRSHLFPQHDGRIPTILIANSKHHGKFSRGGVPPRYETMRRDIVHTLKSHKSSVTCFTTMLDLYGLPRDFPGKDRHVRNPDNPHDFVDALEVAFGNDIADSRFIPYLQLHEYETMLFVEPEAFRVAFDDCDDAIEQLKTIAGSFPSIEHINDGRTTAPSKRIIEVLPAYDGRKPSAGPDIAEFTGVAAIRAKCAHFDAWLTRLEGLWQ